jgi:hypothetical protein
MQTSWRRVEPQQLQQLISAFATDSMAPACTRAIENRLLSSGILFTSRDYSRRASEEFQAHINQHFVRFVRTALQAVSICGWCFFLVEDNIPRVLPPGLADVRWRINNETFTIEMAVFRPGENEPAEDVYSIIDTTIDWQGNVESIMAGYLRTRSLYDAFLRNALQADRLNACPPVYTTTQTDQVFDERDITNTGEVEGLRARLVGTELNTRARLAVNAHDYNESIVRTLNTRSADALRREKTDARTGIANYDADLAEAPQPVIPLPLDTRVAQAPRATARTDIVAILKHFETLCCVSFGVNGESVGADVRSGGHLGAQTLERVNIVTSETTQRWARLFEPTLVQIYKLIWGADDEDDAKVDEVTVVFPSTLPGGTIERLYASKVLSHAAYVSYMGQVVQLPANAFETGDYRAGVTPAQATRV